MTRLRTALRTLVMVVVTSATLSIAVAVTGRLRDANPATALWTNALVSISTAILLTAAFSRWLNHQWSKPADDITVKVQRLTGGDWSTRSSLGGSNQMQGLTVALNLLAQDVQSQLADLRAQRGALQALVDTLPDAIVTTDTRGRIVMINQPASRLLALQSSQAIGKMVVAAVNDHAVLELYDIVTTSRAPVVVGESGPSVQRPVRLFRNGQRLTYEGFATRMVDGGVLLLLRDMSELTANVQMKTDFVANASHELRTPIAAIKIAFETLRDVYGDDAVQADRCVQIIDGHLFRLEEMLRDLLDLSRVESPDLKPQMHDVPVPDVFGQIRASLGAFAREKLVELKLTDSPDAVPTLYTDERLLNLILKNLVENSIKFTPPGGSVAIELESHGDDAVSIVVIDTGIGIPPELAIFTSRALYQPLKLAVDPFATSS